MNVYLLKNITLVFCLVICMCFQQAHANRSLLYTLPRAIGGVSLYFGQQAYNVGQQAYTFAGSYWQTYVAQNADLINSSAQHVGVEIAAAATEQGAMVSGVKALAPLYGPWQKFSIQHPRIANNIQKTIYKTTPRLIVGGIGQVEKRYFSSDSSDDGYIRLYRGHKGTQTEFLSDLAIKEGIDVSNQVLIDAQESGSNWIDYIQESHSISSDYSPYISLTEDELSGMEFALGLGHSDSNQHGFGDAYLTEFLIPRSLLLKGNEFEDEYLFPTRLDEKYIVRQQKVATLLGR